MVCALHHPLIPLTPAYAAVHSQHIGRKTGEAVMGEGGGEVWGEGDCLYLKARGEQIWMEEE